jgi:hypothetical protein
MPIKTVATSQPSDYGVEAERIARQRKMAEVLQQEAMQGAPAGQMFGNAFVGTSPLTHLAKALQGVNARQYQTQADQEAKALGERRRADTGADMQSLIKALHGTKASTETIVDEQANGGMGQTAQINAPAVSPMDSLQAALPNMRTPEMQSIAMQQAMALAKPKEPKWQLTELRQPDGTVKKGYADMNSASPESTFRPLGVEPVKREFVAGQPVNPYTQTTPVADPNQLMSLGADGKPVVNQPLVDVKKGIAAAGKANVTTNVLPPQKTFENENKLRDDYTTATKPFVGIRDAYNTVQAALSGPITATSTLAGATKFMKMIDPESVVRESELNMALKATGMLDRFMNLHNTVLKGQVLTPKQAEEIKAIAETLYTTAAAQQAKTDEYYSGLATSYGLKPERVIRKQDAVMKGEKPQRRSTDKKEGVVDFNSLPE